MLPPSATSTGSAAGNMARALTLVHTGQVTRRSELTERLGVTRAGVGHILRELAGLGLVTVGPASTGPTGGAGGRPSPTLTIPVDAPACLALHIGADAVRVAEARLGGRLENVRHVPVDRPDDAEAVLTLVADLIRERPVAAALGVGVAVPSAVGPSGVALSALPLNWAAGVTVLDRLRALLSAGNRPPPPVVVGNDANLAALAEARHGAGRGAHQMLFVTSWPHGVGGGLVIDGRLHTGSSGHALEVGHVTVDAGGRRCHCGNTGCLEMWASPAALLTAAGRSDVARSDVGDAAREVLLARADDPVAAAAVSALVEHLAIGLGALVNILDPDRIVLGDFQADVLTADPVGLRAAVGRRSYLAEAGRLDIVAAELTQPALVGAAELALQLLLDDPRHTLENRLPADR